MLFVVELGYGLVDEGWYCVINVVELFPKGVAGVEGGDEGNMEFGVERGDEFVVGGIFQAAQESVYALVQAGTVDLHEVILLRHPHVHLVIESHDRLLLAYVRQGHPEHVLLHHGVNQRSYGDEGRCSVNPIWQKTNKKSGNNVGKSQI